MTESSAGSMILVDDLAALLLTPLQKRVVLDCRSFLDFNTNHVIKSVNVGCSKLLKRRLQNDKMLVTELLAQNFHVEIDLEFEVYVYDQSTSDISDLQTDSCLAVLMKKLTKTSKSVSLLRGGFAEFEALHPELCMNKRKSSVAMGDGTLVHHPQHHSISQPCLPVTNLGPTKVLPFLFLGSQVDALCLDTMTKNGIGYVLNVSPLGQKPGFIQDGHFLRIPVNDNYSDKLLPFFHDVFQFLDKVREANGRVLVHCLAGISRSPTVVIAYVMRTLKMNMDEAYRYVKEKRPSISPNFNFLGQLLEYEMRQMETWDELEERIAKRKCVISDDDSGAVTSLPTCQLSTQNISSPCWMFVSSPTQALAQLSFGQLSPLKEQPSPPIAQQVDHSVDHSVDQPVPANSGVPCLLFNSSVSDEGHAVFRIGRKHSSATRPASSHELYCQRSTGDNVTVGVKRPFRRPNSIAFVPLREEVQTSVESTVPGVKISPAKESFQEKDTPCFSDIKQQSPVSMEAVERMNAESIPGDETLSSSSSGVPPFESKIKETVEMECSGKIYDDDDDDGDDGGGGGDEMAPQWRRHKSRSLEDILRIGGDSSSPSKKNNRTNVCANTGCYVLSTLASPLTFALEKPFLDYRSSNPSGTLGISGSLLGSSKPNSLEMITVS